MRRLRLCAGSGWLPAGETATAAGCRLGAAVGFGRARRLQRWRPLAGELERSACGAGEEGRRTSGDLRWVRQASLTVWDPRFARDPRADRAPRGSSTTVDGDSARLGAARHEDAGAGPSCKRSQATSRRRSHRRNRSGLAEISACFQGPSGMAPTPAAGAN